MEGSKQNKIIENFDINSIVVKETFEFFIDPLSEETFQRLEADILEHGIQTPLILWKDNTLIDGHHRYKIAKKHNLPINVIILDKYDNEIDVLKWMMRLQNNRRNLTNTEKAHILRKFFTMNEDVKPSDKEEIIRSVGISPKLFEQYDFLVRNADEKFLELLKDPNIAISSAYTKFMKSNRNRHRPKLEFNREGSDSPCKYINENCLDVMEDPSYKDLVNVVITEPPHPTDEFFVNKYPDDLQLRKSECMYLLSKVCQSLIKFTKTDTSLFFIIDPDYLSMYLNIIEKNFIVKHCIVWDKGTADVNPDPKKLNKRYKMIIFAYKGEEPTLSTRFICDMISRLSSVLFKNPGLPYKLIEEIIHIVEHQKYLYVFDPFAGYGSTLIAALNKRIKSIGCEISETIYKNGTEIMQEYFEEVK